MCSKMGVVGEMSSKSAKMPFQGSSRSATRRFYDEIGWKVEGGKTRDADLFGAKQDGPLQKHLEALHVERVKQALGEAGQELRLLECGCGGNPATALLDLCRHYTGTDFSSTGLEVAEERLAQLTVPYQLRQADVCALPFEDAEFDAVYSAHMIYHIDRPEEQERALAEMMRVLRPSGVLVLVCANPRPALFPFRLAKRVVADTPWVGERLKKLRKAPPLPYQPMPLSWMREKLERHGRVELATYSLPSTAVKQNVHEGQSVGRQVWKAIKYLETEHPKLSAYLGNYVMFKVTRRSGGAE